MKTEENKKNRVTALIATGVIGTFFVGSSAFLYVDNNHLKEENKVQTEQVENLSHVKATLQADLQKIDAELAQYKGKNQELDNLLNTAYKDLEQRKVRINKLLKQNASLPKLKKEAAKLRKLEKNYLARIDKMQEKINMLSEENSYLKNDNQKLKTELQELNNNYMLLERKVEIASVLKVDKVLALAEKKSRKGKFSKVSSSKKTDRLIINFDLSENKVADAGEKSIYIRIIDPAGNVLAAPSKEKGFFSNPDGNIELPYSIQKKVDYNNKEIKTSAIYEIGQQELKSGTYTLEFYCEGYFCGASKYHLR